MSTINKPVTVTPERQSLKRQLNEDEEKNNFAALEFLRRYRISQSFSEEEEQAVANGIASVEFGGEEDDPLVAASPADHLGYVNIANNDPMPPNAKKVANWNLIQQQLLNNGATDVQGLGILFKFNSYQAKLNAQTAMQGVIPWAFFIGPNSAATLNVVPGIPTVNAAIVTFYTSAVPGGRITSNDENFFMIGR